MEALRHAAEGELYRRSTQMPPLPLRSRKPATVFKAWSRAETGIVFTETQSFRTDALMEELSKSCPQMDGDGTANGQATLDQVQHDAHLELITLPKIGDRRDRIGLDQNSLIELYKHLDLDPWLLGQLCRRSNGWTCCTLTEGIINFQLMTSMYYIAWSVNTTRAATCTKAILLAQEHINYSRSFSVEPILETLFETSVVSLGDPFGLANLVLLDIISYMEGELDHQRGIEVQSENLSGHGVFGYRCQEEISDLETKQLASAAREIGVSVGMVSYCNRLADLAEQMVLDLQDEVAKLMAPPDDPDRSVRAKDSSSTGHTSMKQSLHSNMKRIWNFKVEAKDLDNRVRAQSNTIFALISNRHAEAARRDSGSMKTIAVMTMVFLPGTFFAALFAVPSLDWSGPKVITGNFWLYWAFTVPSTVMVFIAWSVLSINRSSLKLAGKCIIGDRIYGSG